MAKGLFKKVFSFGSNPKTDSDNDVKKEAATPALSPFEAYKAAQAKKQSEATNTENNEPVKAKKKRPDTSSENIEPALAEKKKAERQPS